MMRASLALCACLLLVSGASALFEDQAGTFDWYKSYVGHVLQAEFHRTKPRLFVGTEPGVVGALNLKDGSIAWRHKLGADGQSLVATRVLDSQALVLTLTSGCMLQAWEMVEGTLRWEVAASKCDSKPSLAIGSGNSPSVLLLAGGQIQTVNPVKGEVVSRIELADEAQGASITHVQPRAGAPIAFAFTPGTSDVRSYAEEKENVPFLSLPASVPLSSVSAVGPAGFAVLSEDFTTICSTGLTNTVQALECASLAGLAPELVRASGSPSMQLVATATGFAVASGDPERPGAALFKVTLTSGAMTRVHGSAAASAVSAPVTAAGGTEYVAFVEVASSSDAALSLAVVNTAKGEVVGREGPYKGAATERRASGGDQPTLAVARAALGTFKKKDGSDGFRAALVWSDQRLTLLQQGVTVWGRDEAMASISKAMFSDLPASTAAAGEASGFGAAARAELNNFLRLQLLSVKVQFKAASAAEVAEYGALRSALSDRNQPTRDTRGFRRAILAATGSGRLAALHNGDGRLLWAREFGQGAAPRYLLHWTAFHDLTHAPRAAVIGAGPDQGFDVLTVVDTTSGAVVERVELPFRVDKLVPIGHVAEGAAQQELYLAISLPSSLLPPGALPSPGMEGAELPIVRVLPDTPLARAHVASVYRSLYFWVDTSKAEGAGSGQVPSLQGFGFSASAAAALAEGKPAEASPAWSLTLQQPLLALAARDPSEPSYSSVKVLGDRSIKYRYLNPNTLLLVTGLPPGKAVAPADKDSVAANIMVVDSVTGRVLHSQAAPGARGPAAATLSENLAVVQLWDSAASRFVVTSLELYDATGRDFSVLDALFNPNATAPQSSFAPPPLEVLTQSFYTRLPARALATTRTRAGITPKLVLSLTTSDQVYALDARFVDPRRPRHAKLTPEEAEERLIPYQDTLPLAPISFTSYNKQVLGLSGVVAAPSNLESTSLLFSWGLDLQYTRVSPARGFDTLDDDFSYGLLVVALVGLTVAAGAMHWYTKQSLLSSKWA